MAFVENQSGGRLKIKPVWSGALLSSDMSMEELRHGVADIRLVTPIYMRGATHPVKSLDDIKGLRIRAPTELLSVLDSLGVVQPPQFAALARIMVREDWLSDPQFAASDARRVNFDAMHAQLSAVFATDTASAWEKRLSDAGIPCGMVRRVDEAADLAGDAALIELAIPGLLEEKVRIPGAGYRVAGQPTVQIGAPPRLDADRASILAWLAEGCEKP
ncbi:CoA transferase [Novosphingobium sp. ERN07]|uniref:CoA transferase n=1 Tax=Novosphingobium sp. ERN07 TaxID=2726187 RepID=UPI0019824394|nr:CoA transferase [Novosphingobium sp. ERN07]